MRPTFIALFLALFLALSADAQSCTNGDNDDTAHTQRIPFTWQNDFTALTRLISYYMPSYGDGDSMTEHFSLYGGMIQPFGSDGPRETWYIPRDNLSGTAPFYRLLGGLDHMDSEQTNEGGYQFEYVLGYPWTSQQTGTKALTRYFNYPIFDHRTWLNTQTPPSPAGYNVDRRWDTASGTPRYGYERFGNKLQWCDTDAVAYTNNSIENASFKVEFNKVWGNAIGRIWWKGTTPATQIVSENIGAMVQSTIFNTAPKYVNGVLTPDQCCDYNPTQSGGWDNENVGNTRRWAGSPVLSASFQGTTKHTTELKPFNFPFGVWEGSDELSPLMWRGTFQKITTLGFTIGTTTYPDVLLISFNARRDNTGVRSINHNMNNTHWLKMALLGNGDVPNGFKIDRVRVDNGATEAVTFPAGQYGTKVSLQMDGRALMFSRNDGTFAMGFHHIRTDPGDPRYEFFFWCDGAAPANGSCPAANQAFTVNTFNNHTLGTTYSTATQQNTYIVMGTRANVIRRMRQIECVRTGGTNCNSIP